jgi:hypothetical protein
VAPLFKSPHDIIEPSALRAAKALSGSITTWGNSGSGGINAPTDKGYTKIYSSERAFAALKADGSIMSWGDLTVGAFMPPLPELPHVVIEPSALRAAKARSFE